MGTRERKLLIYTNLLIIFHFPLLSTHSIPDIHKRFSFLIFLLPHSSHSLLWRVENFLFSRKYWFEKYCSWNATIVEKKVYDFKDDEFVFLFIQQSYFYSPAKKKSYRKRFVLLSLHCSPHKHFSFSVKAFRLIIFLEMWSMVRLIIFTQLD